ncbi:hypothetical protein EVAR_70255_1 [Eumeta japonica]|uniref:Uncharacterized protein n=1 Tax=Eumeta variegata TaxID=151549 RepID=A0A4C2A2P8_EUMVA|nr:hypothetical protein EVAR_70255_1 [Eumeta japonica]
MNPGADKQPADPRYVHTLPSFWRCLSTERAGAAVVAAAGRQSAESSSGAASPPAAAHKSRCSVLSSAGPYVITQCDGAARSTAGPGGRFRDRAGALTGASCPKNAIRAEDLTEKGPSVPFLWLVSLIAVTTP